MDHMSLGMELSLGPGDFVLDGDPAPPPQKGAEHPKFSAHVYCGQTAGWIKMVLGVEVGLSQGDTVLDGDQALSPEKGQHPLPIFGPFLLWPNGWIDQDSTWHGDRPLPRRLCVGWGPSRPLNFWPMFIVVIVISLEHCTCIIGLFKCSMHSIF